jgi:3-phosphoshikimate 1-carboxyvinyltransferase
MAEELEKMRVDVEERSDGLIIRQSRLRPVRLDGRSDHRIVMALSLAGLAMEGGCTIETAEAMSVTFPNYVELMNMLGGKMRLERSTR